jgi:hypothetical protein
VKGLYVFNSYRVTYRYEPVRRENWMFGFGVTVKVRDAEARLEAGGNACMLRLSDWFSPTLNVARVRAIGATPAHRPRRYSP